MKKQTSPIKWLSAIGLHADEAALYIYLVEHGASDVANIARNLSITRVTAYTHLKKLLEEECVIKIKPHKRFLYEAEDPNTLLSRFETSYRDGVQALTRLSQTHKKTLFIPEITFHAGLDQIRNIYDDVALTLPKGGTFFRYTSRSKEVGYSPLYAKLRKEKELERLVITSISKSERKKPDADRFLKTVPKDFAFDDNVTVLIYGTKVAYMDFNSDTGVTIESPHLARFQEKIFKLLWKKL